MGEITRDDRDQVARFIQGTFGVPERDEALDYASIAVFLSDSAQWEAWVTSLSRGLELEYWYRAYQGYGNRLSGAIAGIGRTLGFDGYQNGVVMAGYTEESVFKSYVESKAFWKDAVSANHGEHSHSIQWLAIALAAAAKEGLSLRNPVTSLYKKTVSFKSNVEFTRPGEGGKSSSSRVTLWDFLVDCFNHGGQPDFESNIITHTARSPTALNSKLQAMPIWLGRHIKGRYDARGWGAPSNQPVSIKESAAQKSKEKGYRQKAQYGADNFLYEYTRSDTASSVKPKPVIEGLIGKLTVSSGRDWNGPKTDKTATITWTSPSGGQLRFGYGSKAQVEALPLGTKDVMFDMVLATGSARPTPANFKFRKA